MCWWMSLGSGDGRFHERAHSTSPSSVAPAGWRPLGSGFPVGTLTCSITAEHRGELRVEIYFLSLPVEHICTGAGTGFKITKKHSFRIPLIYTHQPQGGKVYNVHSFFFPSVRAIIDSA